MSKATIRYFIIALVFMVVSASVFGFMCYQVGKQGVQLVTQIENLQLQQQQEESYFRLQKISQESVADREQLQQYFLAKESDSIDFLNQIEALSPSAGVELKTNQLKLTEDSQWVEASFSVTGSRERLQNFVKILENLPYVSKVVSVNMSTLAQNEWQADIIIHVRVLSYE